VSFTTRTLIKREAERGDKPKEPLRPFPPLVAPEEVPDGLRRELELEPVGGVRILIRAETWVHLREVTVAKIMTVGLRSTKYTRRDTPFAKIFAYSKEDTRGNLNVSHLCAMIPRSKSKHSNHTRVSRLESIQHCIERRKHNNVVWDDLFPATRATEGWRNPQP